MLVTRLAASALVLLLATFGTAGCGQVQDAAQAKASAAASQVATAAAKQVAAQVREQVCARIADGSVSEQDRAVLGGLLETADKAGLPADLTDPLRAVVRSDQKVPAKALDRLRATCARG